MPPIMAARLPQVLMAPKQRSSFLFMRTTDNRVPLIGDTHQIATIPRTSIVPGLIRDIRMPGLPLRAQTLTPSPVTLTHCVFKRLGVNLNANPVLHSTLRR